MHVAAVLEQIKKKREIHISQVHYGKSLSVIPSRVDMLSHLIFSRKRVSTCDNSLKGGVKREESPPNGLRCVRAPIYK